MKIRDINTAFNASPLPETETQPDPASREAKRIKRDDREKPSASDAHDKAEAFPRATLRSQLIEQRYHPADSSSRGAGRASRKRPAESSSGRLDDAHPSKRHHSEPRSSSMEADEKLRLALLYSENRLRPEEVKTLQAQRNAQYLELGQRADSGFPERCLAMARDNVLAQRNGVGNALIFLQASSNAQTNTHWLTRYLVKLTLPPGDAQDRDAFTRIQDCAGLAARYFVQHHGWFKGGPVQRYASIANRLSKFPGNAACLEAIERIAFETAHASDLLDVNMKTGTLLAGAFAKYEKSDLCREGVLRIAQHLLENFHSIPTIQNGTMLLNALSKWPSHSQVEEAACTLAQRLLRDPHLQLKQRIDASQVTGYLLVFSKWPARGEMREAATALSEVIAFNATLRRKMDAVGVSNALAALSKWAEERWAKEAALVLAEDIASNHVLQRRMNAQDMSSSLNALSKWSDEPLAEKAVFALSYRIIKEQKLRGEMGVQAIANSLNAFSKWPGDAWAGKATFALADRVVSDHLLRQKMDANEVAMSLNAFSKWPEESLSQRAMFALAGRVVKDPKIQMQMDTLGVATSLNALSKCFDREHAWEMAFVFADRMVTDHRLRQRLDSGSVSTILNAMSKWSGKSLAGEVVLVLADRMVEDRGLLRKMDAVDVANALNSFCKWSEAPQVRDAVCLLAEKVASDHALRLTMKFIEVTNILNALSKWPEERQMREGAVAVAERVAADRGLQQRMDARSVAITLNAFSKWPNEKPVCNAAAVLAERVAEDNKLRRLMSPQGVSNALNAFSKWPENRQVQKAAFVLAERVISDKRLQQDADVGHVTTILNALSKWPGNEKITDAARAMAQRVAEDESLRQSLNASGMSITLNALSKWQEEPLACRASLALMERLVADETLRRSLTPVSFFTTLNAIKKWSQHSLSREAGGLLTGQLGTRGYAWRDFDIRGMSQIANALVRLSGNDEQEIMENRMLLEGLSAYLELHPERFADADLPSVGTLFKAYGNMHIPRALRPLAMPAIERVQALFHLDRLRDNSLESVATLCLGLLPVARSPELLRHRSLAVKTLEMLQPVVAQKIDGYLGLENKQPDCGGLSLRDDGEACGTRYPALSFYQVLKTYNLVARQWSMRNVDGDRNQIKARQSELKSWVQDLLARTQQVINADLQERSWNLIAQIEANDEVYEALDLRLIRDAATLVERHPPITFDMTQTLRQMRTSPGQLKPPAPGAGATRHIVVDIRGKELKTPKPDAQRDYSFYTRLTGQPLVEVELPGELSGFMLARTFQYQGDPWRFDIFGGSRLKKGRLNMVRNILAGAQPGKSLLPAIRYADTVPNSDFMRLIEKMSPQREDWSRIQRALLEMVPPDHVAEGTLRLGWCADVPGPQHPFKLTSPTGERLALCPNDGCGFLKWEVARRLPVVSAYVDAWEASRAGHASQTQRRLLKGQDAGQNNIPPQALMHYPRSESVQAEAHEVLQRRLAELRTQNAVQDPGETKSQEPLSPETVDRLALYRMTVSGGYQGRRLRAVPSADDRLYLPTVPLPGFLRPEGDLLLGKPPYDKEYLLPIAAEKVVTPSDEDATARFLDQCFAIQYSYSGVDEDSGEDADMLHCKGMLIIPPPGYWSPAHADQDMVCSREDLKILSRWTFGRDRDSLPEQMLSTGSLRVKDVLVPGRLAGLPIPELRKRNMDTDGDDAFVYAGYPQLSAHIRAVMDERARRRGVEMSFKPPKTATAAMDAQGRYHTGRAQEILNDQRGGKLIGAASEAANRFLAQPDELREKMARRMMFGIYDGVERSLRNGLRKLLAGDQDAPPLAALSTQAEAAIGQAHQPEAREVAVLLHYLTQQLASPGAQMPALAISDAVAQVNRRLAEAYAKAPDTAARIHAVLDYYPVCRLSHEQYPNGQPGLVPGEPELTIRNLFTLAVKVGTDALKSDTGTVLFSKILDNCVQTERHFPERIRKVPYTKQTARMMQEGRFNPEEAKKALAVMPTLAAAVMEDAVDSLQKMGLLSMPPTLQARTRSLSPQALKGAAQALNSQARLARRRITDLLQRRLPDQARLAGLDHSIKSVGSIEEKLRYLTGKNQLDLSQAVSQLNDALRYSVVMPCESFTESYRKLLAALDDEGHTLIQRTNYFTQPHVPFRAINVTLRESSGGQHWEIQFHTEETFMLKERYHDSYKDEQRLRRQGMLSGGLSEARQAFRKVQIPPGCLDIDDMRASGGANVRTSAPRQSPRSRSGLSTPLQRQAEVILEQARSLERRISPRLRQLLQAYDGQLRQDKQGNWRQFIFKKPDSIVRKLAERQQNESARSDRVRDALRYEVILAPEGFGGKAQAILNGLRCDGLEMVAVRNGFLEHETTYAGVNVKLRDTEAPQGEGHFEVQFHTRDSLRAKLDAHRDYEALRKLPANRSAADTDEMWSGIQNKREDRLDRIRHIAARVPLPDDIASLAAFERYTGM
ncbi:XopAD/skwp family type III secretion system effector [Brenneria rubrifaciens]|uniref:Type III effector protein (Skwp5) n=1 Tax=Brenneria rubrifaciens TaxID=55213 RepID=A0A4P8QZL6_9GAMM|nr:XopAD/skwp family type III secretion system effector [Brenneria rubrifaciens]QCR09755.1 Type III effector protein (Skwp5) [Brenneria rubrifaciens]